MTRLRIGAGRGRSRRSCCRGRDPAHPVRVGPQRDRRAVQCLPAGAAAPACYVYRGASSDSHVPVDATAAGNYDVSECVPPITVADGTELTFRWLAVPAGSTVRAEVDYTMDDTTGGDGA